MAGDGAGDAEDAAGVLGHAERGGGGHGTPGGHPLGQGGRELPAAGAALARGALRNLHRFLQEPGAQAEEHLLPGGVHRRAAALRVEIQRNILRAGCPEERSNPGEVSGNAPEGRRLRLGGADTVEEVADVELLEVPLRARDEPALGAPPPADRGGHRLPEGGDALGGAGIRRRLGEARDGRGVRQGRALGVHGLDHLQVGRAPGRGGVRGGQAVAGESAPAQNRRHAGDASAPHRAYTRAGRESWRHGAGGCEGRLRGAAFSRRSSGRAAARL